VIKNTFLFSFFLIIGFYLISSGCASQDPQRTNLKKTSELGKIIEKQRTSAADRAEQKLPPLTPEEVERLVTLPLELEMNGVPHMVVMRSISLSGLSDVILTFEESTGSYFARHIVFERHAARTSDMPANIGLPVPDVTGARMDGEATVVSAPRR
jgi:hypothetical protein